MIFTFQFDETILYKTASIIIYIFRGVNQNRQRRNAINIVTAVSETPPY